MSADDGAHITARRRLADAAQLAGRGRFREAADLVDRTAHGLECLAEEYRGRIGESRRDTSLPLAYPAALDTNHEKEGR